jgi:MscS family membrane protein
MKDVSKSISARIVRLSLSPFLVFLLLLLIYIFYKTNIFSKVAEQFQQSVKKYFLTALILNVGFVLQRMVDMLLLWYKEKVALKTTSHLDEDMIPLIKRSSRVLIWVIALLVILPLYGVNVNALIAALGVGSLAIALAAQDTIANIIAGFMIMVDRPFREGDEIKLPSGETVKVLNIGLRRSTFLSEDKAIIIVPNLELNKSKIVNFTYGKERGLV